VIRETLIEGFLFDLCIPTFVAVLAGIGALIALGSFIWEVRQVRYTRRTEGTRPTWRPLPPLAWFKLAGSLVGLALVVVSFQACLPDVRISLPDSRLNPAAGGQQEDPGAEYVCLVSHEDGAVSLTGWELRDADERINVLPKFTLEGGAAVRVHPAPGRNAETDLYRDTKSRHWNNSGGEISLYDDEGQEIDRVSYGPRGQDDGSGECGTAAGLSLAITSPANLSVVHRATVTIRGTVTPGSTVHAKIDHDDESESGGAEARITSGEGLDRFAVDLRLDHLGENSIRVQAEKSGAEPVTEFLGLVRRRSTVVGPPPRCDPNYKGACLDRDAVDYDCLGGEGDGPEYVEGPIEVVGEDRFDLDRNEDGIACEP
jgi:hypothetical protein